VDAGEVHDGAGPGHVLDAAGDHAVALARRDGVGRAGDSLRRRRTPPVDRRRRHRLAQLREERDDPTEVVPLLAGLLCTPPGEVVDVGRPEPGPRQQVVDDRDREVLAAKPGEGAVTGALRRPGGGDDHRRGVRGHTGHLVVRRRTKHPG